MGADIHMYVEYRNKERSQEELKLGRKPYWHCYGDRINPGRNYALFAVLAGVRGQYEDSFIPKGKLEKDEMGYISAKDAHLYIIDKPSDEIREEGCCSLEQAQR